MDKYKKIRGQTQLNIVSSSAVFFQNKEACPRPAPENPGTNLLFILFAGDFRTFSSAASAKQILLPPEDLFFLPDLRSRSFNRL